MDQATREFYLSFQLLNSKTGKVTSHLRVQAFSLSLSETLYSSDRFGPKSGWRGDRLDRREEATVQGYTFFTCRGSWYLMGDTQSYTCPTCFFLPFVCVHARVLLKSLQLCALLLPLVFARRRMAHTSSSRRAKVNYNQR